MEELLLYAPHPVPLPAGERAAAAPTAELVLSAVEGGEGHLLLPPLKLRRPFLLEGGQALTHVFGVHVEIEHGEFES